MLFIIEIVGENIFQNEFDIEQTEGCHDFQKVAVIEQPLPQKNKVLSPNYSPRLAKYHASTSAFDNITLPAKSNGRSKQISNRCSNPTLNSRSDHTTDYINVLRQKYASESYNSPVSKERGAWIAGFDRAKIEEDRELEALEKVDTPSPLVSPSNSTKVRWNKYTESGEKNHSSWHYYNLRCTFNHC